MDLKKYEELTGIEVPTSDEARVKANIRRTKAALETLLGYTLKPKNLYTEKGKVRFEGFLPVEDYTDNLLPADETQSEGIKLFSYHENDKYFHVDPFRNVYSVKLVMPVNDNEFVTIIDLDNVVAQYQRNNVSRFIERHFEWFTWAWYRTWVVSWEAGPGAGLQLAVDADWLNCYPDDILYLWADMVTYQTDPNNNIKSESVDGHSWSKGSVDAPEESDSAKALLKQYAGPNGTIIRNPVG